MVSWAPALCWSRRLLCLILTAYWPTSHLPVLHHSESCSRPGMVLRGALHSPCGLAPSQRSGRKEEREADQHQWYVYGTHGRVSEAATAVRSLAPESWASRHQDSHHAHTSGRVPRTWRSCPPSAGPHAPSLCCARLGGRRGEVHSVHIAEHHCALGPR